MTNVERIIESLVFIEWHMKEDIDVSRISAEVGYSPRYFKQLFRKVTGVSVNSYLCRRRLTEALKSLRKEPGNIFTVASEYRFNCVREFKQKFLRQFKIHPAKIDFNKPPRGLQLQEAIVYDVINKARIN